MVSSRSRYASPPMMPPMPCTPWSSAMTAMRDRACRSCRRAPGSARPSRAWRIDRSPRDLLGVEHVERPAEIEGDVVGDVDQRRDRPQADRLQPALQPFGRGAVLDAAEMAADDDGAGAVGPAAAVARPLDRAVEGCQAILAACTGFSVPEARGGQIARDAMDAQAIGAVGRDLDVDHRIVEAERLAAGCADGASAASSMMPSMLVGQAPSRARSPACRWSPRRGSCPP